MDYIKIDVAHTYAIAGYGKEELASTLVFLAVRCSVWGPGNFEHQLEEAYGAFREWCRDMQKVTTITEFSKTELKITSPLVSSTKRFRRLRLQCYPRGLGKGSDAAKVGAWLQSVMGGLTPQMLPATWTKRSHPL